MKRHRPPTHSVRSLAPRVLALVTPHTWTLAVGLLALIAGSGINLLFPHLIREVLNENLAGLKVAEHLGSITLLLIALFVVQASFFYVRHFCFTAVGYRVATDLKSMLYRSLINQDIAFFDRSRTGDLLSRLSADTQLVQRAVTTNISVALRYLLQIVGGILLMLFISLQLTSVIFLLIPLIVVASIYWGKKLRRYSKQTQEELGEANVIAEETLSTVRTVRAFAGSDYEVNRYTQAISKALATGLLRTKIAALFSSTMVFVIHSSIAVVFWYGGKLVMSQSLTIGDLTAFLLYGVIVAVSLGFLANVWDEFMQAIGAGERIFEILDSKPKITSPVTAKSLPRTTSGSISFERVTFYYPSRPEVIVLKEVSFEIKTGQTVAVVGPSGAGKSTIASLIPRYYDPANGVIRYCGIPLAELNIEELRSHISIVAQDPQVFSVSILENIGYGKIGATTTDIIEAARAANIHDFINSLPNGYDTLVGDRGIQLSGGQRQRVAIARAILKDPKFLILDEATSALDSENEKLVREALIRLMRGRTTLVIAHRLSTVQHADRVLVLKDGQICQTGEHTSLVKEPGLYRTLVEHQLL